MGGAPPPGASPHQRWHLTMPVSGHVFPRHCRSLSETPPSAPAPTAFTLTTEGVSAVVAPAVSAPAITDMSTFYTCERWWSIFVKQLRPHFFTVHGGDDVYAFYLQEVDKLARMFGVPAAMQYDEGVRKAVFLGKDSRSVPVTSFEHFDIKLHQDCFFTSQMAALSATPSVSGITDTAPSRDKGGDGGGSKRGSQKDLSSNCRKVDGKQVCFNFNLGRCLDASCKYAHVCTACGQSHAERPKGLIGKRCRKKPPTSSPGSSAPGSDSTTSTAAASADAAP
jgi:hypothetical protein